MSELKNCQCGCSKPHVIRHELLSTGYKYYNVACGECQITQTTDYPTESEAITAWNTRPASPRFSVEEREAMEVVVSEANCSTTNGCVGCRWKYENCTNDEHHEMIQSAIATVRDMLTASEFADKGKG